MRKFKISLLVFYIIMIVVLIYESAIPESLSVKEHSFFKKIVNNISRVFVKTKYIDATEIVINNDLNESYYINDTLTINALVKPDNASYKELSFTSTDTNVLTVDNTGFINFLNVGNASVIIRQKDSNIEKIIDFKVVKEEEPVIDKVLPDGIVFNVENDTLYMGEYTALNVGLTRSDNKKITDRVVSFSSTDKSVAMVRDGKILAFKEGEVDITVKHTTTSISATKHIKVLHKDIVEPTSFVLKGETTITIGDKKTHTYTVEIKPDNVSDIYKIVHFIAYSYDPINDMDIDRNSGLSIDTNTGKSSGLNAGYSKVYAFTLTYSPESDKLEWFKFDSIIVETKNTLPSFSLKDRRIVLGDPYKLVINPHNKSSVTYDKYEYKSSDESIASIDNLGNITPHKKGTATITVRVDDGYYYVEESFLLTVDSKVMEDNMGRKSFSTFVRKGLSHFMGFVIFGLISSFMFLLFINTNYDGNKKLNIVVTIVNGLVFACLTEFIQLFAIGRTSQFKDIAIDYLGYMIAVIFSFIIITLTYLIKKKRRKNDILINNTNEENN